MIKRVFRCRLVFAFVMWLRTTVRPRLWKLKLPRWGYAILGSEDPPPRVARGSVPHGVQEPYRVVIGSADQPPTQQGSSEGQFSSSAHFAVMPASSRMRRRSSRSVLNRIRT